MISFDPNFVVSEDVLELLLFHLRRCWARGNEDSYEYILNFFADMLQHPERKIGVMLLLLSQPGAGKGLILSFIGEFILGDLYVSLPTLRGGWCWSAPFFFVGVSLCFFVFFLFFCFF